MNLEKVLGEVLDKEEGILRLKPTFVARETYPALGRLGITNYSAGKRGWYCERWLASSVEAKGPTQLENEGLSEIDVKGYKIFLRDALAILPERLLGESYARAHNNRFGVLTKILDIGRQIPMHLHAKAYHASKYWNSNPKDEAYYYLEHPNKGPLPYIHAGLHPDVTKEEILEIIKRWNDDKILDLSPAYRMNIGEGFYIPSGILHAPGTALTLEVQEESDVYTMFQAKIDDTILPKDKYLLNGPKTEEEALELIDWEENTDPKFYRKHHLIPKPIIEESTVKEYWIFDPKILKKFSGKKLVLSKGVRIKQNEKGAFLLLTYKGKGAVNRVEVEGGSPGKDELFVSYEASKAFIIENTGNEELVAFKIFGPDVY